MEIIHFKPLKYSSFNKFLFEVFNLINLSQLYLFRLVIYVFQYIASDTSPYIQTKTKTNNIRILNTTSGKQ